MKFFKAVFQWAKSFPERVYAAFLRFPASVACAVALFVISQLQEHNRLFDDNIFFKLVFVLVIGFILFAAGELVLEGFGAKRLKSRVISHVVIYLLLQGYYFAAVGNNDRGFAQFAMLLAGASLLAIMALNIKKGASFEKNAALILVRLASSALFASVLLGGLCAILGGIDLLLTEIDYKRYTDMAQICYIIFLPVMFLMGVPAAGNETDYPKPLKALLSYVVLPLIIVFAAVLYIYYVKLIVTRSLPISEVGGVSISFLAVCIPVLILITPFDSRLSARVRSLLPFVLVPVVFVLFLAALRQIYHYGVTVTRYIVVIGGIAALAGIALIRIKRGVHQRFACAAVALCCVIAALGPQSAYNVSSSSQGKRLEGYLVKNNMLADGKIVPNANISDEDKNEITGLINYFGNNHLNRPAYLPDENADYASVLGFEIKEGKYRHYRADSGVIALDGYDYMLKDYMSNISFAHNGKNVEISRPQPRGSITVEIDGEAVCDIPIADVAKEIYGKMDMEKEEQTQEVLTYIYENGYIKLKIIFDDISFSAAKYEYGTYRALLKIK